jgi:hypothetical protein
VPAEDTAEPRIEDRHELPVPGSPDRARDRRHGGMICVPAPTVKKRSPTSCGVGGCNGVRPGR